MKNTVTTTTPASESDEPDPLLFRAPALADGAAISQLIKDCPPLDQNSTYVYLLLCSHFSKSCIVVQHQDQLVGFISAYLPPEKNDTLFVWQVAVHDSMRGQGLAQRMLDHLLSRPLLQNTRFIETTVDPDNLISRRLFERLAKRHHTEINEYDFFKAEHFIEPQVEPLLRIGPLKAGTLTKENN